MTWGGGGQCGLRPFNVQAYLLVYRLRVYVITDSNELWLCSCYCSRIKVFVWVKARSCRGRMHKKDGRPKS